MMITIEIDGDTAAALGAVVRRTDRSRVVTPAELLAELASVAALGLRRPASWEGQIVASIDAMRSREWRRATTRSDLLLFALPGESAPDPTDIGDPADGLDDRCDVCGAVRLRSPSGAILRCSEWNQHDER